MSELTIRIILFVLAYLFIIFLVEFGPRISRSIRDYIKKKWGKKDETDN